MRTLWSDLRDIGLSVLRYLGVARPVWLVAAKRELRTSGKVAAVKLIRAHTGKSLAEAVEIVNQIGGKK